MITINEQDWVFERSSGFAGMRNIKTGDWLHLDEYEKRLEASNEALAEARFFIESLRQA